MVSHYLLRKILSCGCIKMRCEFLLKKTVRKTINSALTVVMIITLTFLAFTTYIFCSNQKILQDSFFIGYKPGYTTTTSMEPTMKVNSLFFVKTVDCNSVKVGDIIYFDYDGKAITHRIVSITSKTIRTKGDNNDVVDAFTITPKQIKGKVVCVWNWPASIIDWFQSLKNK